MEEGAARAGKWVSILAVDEDEECSPATILPPAHTYTEHRASFGPVADSELPLMLYGTPHGLLPSGGAGDAATGGGDGEDRAPTGGGDGAGTAAQAGPETE